MVWLISVTIVISLNIDLGRNAHTSVLQLGLAAPAHHWITDSYFYVPHAFSPWFSNLKSLHCCSLFSVDHPDCLVFCIKAYWQSLYTQLPKESNSPDFPFVLCMPIKANPGSPRSYFPPSGLLLSPGSKEVCRKSCI